MNSGAAFADFYHAHVQFASHRARDLGVEDAGVDDVVQRVFWVAARRFHEFRPECERGSAKAWVMAILRRVVSEHRRSTRRKSPYACWRRADPDDLADSRGHGPHEALVLAEAARVARRLIDELDEPKREVFVLAELENISVAEIAAALGLNANTVASRLRAARRELDRAAARYRLSSAL